MDIQPLLSHLDQELKPGLFKDYGPNGLQVEGKKEIHKVVTGVTANLSLIQKAIEKKADLILVHHGIFWKHRASTIQGVQYQRIKSLMSFDINLVAYHLPLDAHPHMGNNAQLAKLLGLKIEKSFDLDGQPGLGMVGRLSKPKASDEFASFLEKTLGHTPLYTKGNLETIQTIGWCTGGAESYLETFQALGVDAYLTGEYSLAAIEYAKESGIAFFAAGHHATERYGIQALGEHLKKKFDLDVEYIDIPNPA